jgi:hypothetical protein
MEHTMGQTVNVNFCVKLQKSPNETLEIVKTVYGESPGQKKPRISKSKIETVSICFFDIKGIIHFEFVPEGTAVNQTFYVVLKRLIDAVRRKRGEFWRDRSLIRPLEH